MQKSICLLDAYKACLYAQVEHIEHRSSQYHITLDQTPFYPEGGGQPSDTGTINNIPVHHVYEENGNIYHVVDHPFTVGDSVLCHIDWAKRFDHMQQHSGQHLLSAVMDHLYGANTIGFRLTDQYITIGLDQKLTLDDIQRAEYEANRLIWSNLSVRTYWPDPASLSHLPLRKHPKVEESIRIVEIDQYDFSPCCGTHVSHTGEIGMIKISKFENYKSGIRIEFHCGNRALQRFELLRTVTASIGKDLSATPETLLEAYEKCSVEKRELKTTLQDTQKTLLSYQAASMLSASPCIHSIHIIKSLETCDMKMLKDLAQEICQTSHSVVLLASKDNNKMHVLLQRSKDLAQFDMKSYFTTIAKALNLRGGGTPTAAQGGGDYSDQIIHQLDQLQAQISSLLETN